MNVVRNIVSILLFFALAVVFILVYNLSTQVFSDEPVATDFNDIRHSWKMEPIVSVYIPSDYFDSNCGPDYEPVFPLNTLQGITEGPCGCAENSESFLSSSSSCSTKLQRSNACASLRSLPKVATVAWRKSVICVKRDGQPVATNRKKYHARPLPDKHGQCPGGYKKCGTGSNSQEGATCFPLNADCPITNMLILANNEMPTVEEGWEKAGTFSSNHTLYVRREFAHELPIHTITFQLTQFSNKGASHNKRGSCYKGPSQVINSTAVANPTNLWSYNIALPPVCSATDSRYALIDRVPLQDHFLQNLELIVPACKPFALYPRSDPRYQPARDPDYLNSGVKCGSAPNYKCARDPYHHTNCAAGDDICDGVVHQNVCGVYANAVRSAFSDYKSNGVTLGMYFAREVQWTNQCTVSKHEVFHARGNLMLVFSFHFVMFPVWVYFHGSYYYLSQPGVPVVPHVWICVGYLVFLVLLLVTFLYIRKVTALYNAVASCKCTDLFTQEKILDALEPFNDVYKYIAISLGLLIFLTADAIVRSCCGARNTPSTRTRRPNGYRAVATVEDTPTLAVAVPAHQPPPNLNETEGVSKIASAPSVHGEIPALVENGIELIDRSAENV